MISVKFFCARSLNLKSHVNYNYTYEYIKKSIYESIFFKSLVRILRFSQYLSRFEGTGDVSRSRPDHGAGVTWRFSWPWGARSPGAGAASLDSAAPSPAQWTTHTHASHAPHFESAVSNVMFNNLYFTF